MKTFVHNTSAGLKGEAFYKIHAAKSFMMIALAALVYYTRLSPKFSSVNYYWSHRMEIR